MHTAVVLILCACLISSGASICLPEERSADHQAVSVENEKLTLDKDCTARLKYGVLMVPGSERIEKRGKTPAVFRRVEREPQPGEYTISPVGVLRFNKKDRRAQLYASYSYRPRTVAVLPVDIGAAPNEVGSAIRRETEKLLADHGCRLVPDAKVDRVLQERRLYPSSEFTPQLLRELGQTLDAQDIVILNVESWQSKSGESLLGYLWTGPFDGPRKRVELSLRARLYNTEEGRLLWEGRSHTEKLGGKLGAVPKSLMEAAVKNAVKDLFDSYLAP
ncbi:MAG: hypothetical protein ACP5R4_06520 [Armatimonadota bacterium]